MKDLKTIISEKLKIDKNTKQKIIKRAPVQDVINYLNDLTNNSNPKITWGQDEFFEGHWPKNIIKYNEDKNIIPANYFISQIFNSKEEINIKQIRDKYFKDNNGVINLCLNIIKATKDKFICLIYDNRLDLKYKKVN